MKHLVFQRILSVRPKYGKLKELQKRGQLKNWSPENKGEEGSEIEMQKVQLGFAGVYRQGKLRTFNFYLKAKRTTGKNSLNVWSKIIRCGYK